MPPSPELRFSPGRDQAGDSHNRVRGLEEGAIFKEQDHDLALFSEMQSRERENFLLQSSNDFEDSFSLKMKNLEDSKLGLSVPVRGESSELLSADGEKNDYDWLLTPPDTPLFPSLDDDSPPANIASRGRQSRQTISISRSSTMEKSHRSSRGSPSPNILSPSPRPGTRTLQSRGRPSSAHHSSPMPGQQPITTSRRLSPSPNKTTTPAPRSSTPTSRRMSTGSRARGTSPVRTSQGNSASPKVREWQSSIPGFSSEAPPNLRTSLADRPASYVRGSSPASRNSRDSSSKFGRQSMSPTASRSASSLHSQDRDRISSQSKGSMASSGDDDVDSLQSIHVGSLDQIASKGIGVVPNNRGLGFAKKSTGMLSTSSAPKRSFDSILRQMDNRNSPQNMFRPLLSCVPSTFYGGSASSAHRSLISRNSSVTTSSNASSDQGISVVPDFEGSDHYQEDLAIESQNVQYTDAQEEVFAADTVDTLNKNIELGADGGSFHIQLSDFGRDQPLECEPVDSEDFSNQDIDMEISSASDSACVRADFSEVDSLENVNVCSKCGCQYLVSETEEKDMYLCPNCSRQDNLVAVSNPETTVLAAGTSPLPTVKIPGECFKSDEPEHPMSIPETKLQVMNLIEETTHQHRDGAHQGKTLCNEENHICLHESSHSNPVVEGGEQWIAGQQGTGEASIGYSLPDNDALGQQLPHFDDYPNLKVAVAEGSGISLLLRRSSSSKGPVFQGRSFTASTISFDDLSFTRESVNSLRSSIGHCSVSTSTSIDFDASRQSESRVKQRSSGRKSDAENHKYNISTIPQSTGSSAPGTLYDAHQSSGLAASTYEEHIGAHGALKNDGDGSEEAYASFHRKVSTSENSEMDVSGQCFTGGGAPKEDFLVQDVSCRALVASSADLACDTLALQLEENSVFSLLNNENSTSLENEKELNNNAGNLFEVTSSIPSEPSVEQQHTMQNTDQDVLDVAEVNNNAGSLFEVETSSIASEPSVEQQHTIQNTDQDVLDVAEVPTHRFLASTSEIEVEHCFQSTSGSDSDGPSAHSENATKEFWDPLLPMPSQKEVAASVSEQNPSNVLEESTILVESQGGSKARSLTLEEATDTILFCSSIVHDLAYKAATLAIAKEREKESSIPVEGSWPTVTVVGKSTADRKDSRGRTAGKHTSKSLKVRKKRVEVDAKLPSSKVVNDENTNKSRVRNVGVPNKMDSMKPPKLESKCNCTIM